MKTQGILVVVVILLSTAGLVQAQEDQISGTLDVTYLSRYIWRGIDMYPSDHSAIQPSVNLNLWDTGFGLKVLMSRANGGGFENSEEIDYTLSYGDSLYEGESCQMNYAVGWMYYSYPDMPRHHPTASGKDAQEVFASFSFPQICPAGVVPSYTVIYMWQAEGGESGFRKCEGVIHVLGLGYDVTVPGLTAGTPEQVINLSAAAVYNAGTVLPTVKHDWSHAVFGASTSFDLGNDLTFTPGVYYQSSWEDSVNTSD